MTNRNFDEWLSKFRPSISSYDYYIDFDKVVKNVEEIKVELNILNSLIGSKNIEDEFESTTVGGWITELNGGFPTLGQELVWKNLRLKVDALDDRRVLQVSVEILPKQEEAEDED